MGLDSPGHANVREPPVESTFSSDQGRLGAVCVTIKGAWPNELEVLEADHATM